MRHNKIILFIFAALAFQCVVLAAEESTSAGLQGSNLMNPNISAIGWLQAEAGHRDPSNVTSENSDAVQLKEVELALQSVVDPYSKAEFIISFTPENVEVEEGTINWFALPGGLALKAGKFKANFGRFNRVHTGETAFADRPLVEKNYFGEEGLAGTGGSLSWQIPNPLLLLNLDLEAMTAPHTDDVPTFEKAGKNKMLYVSRLGGYSDITEATNASFGASYAYGPAGESFDSISNSSSTQYNTTAGVDLTFRWKNPRRAIYKSFVWNTEALRNHQQLAPGVAENSWGMFSHMEFQFARRWRVGGRYDYTEAPDDHTNETKGGLVYLTFTPSEFSLISLQGEHNTLDNGDHEDLAFLKTTFNIGPHGAHPF